MRLAEAQQIVGRRLYGAAWIGCPPVRVRWLITRRGAGKKIIGEDNEVIAREIAAAEDLFLQMASQYQHVQDWLVEHKFSWNLDEEATTRSWDSIDPIALEGALAYDPDMLPESANDIADYEHGLTPSTTAISKSATITAAANEWMLANFKKGHKRDPMLQACMEATDCTYRQPQDAYRGVPEDRKRSRGRRDRPKSGK